MSTGQHQVYSNLVQGLLDAREEPAVVRFDDELAAAVTRGEVSPQTAERLRTWQRASVRGVADHVRAVLPTVLSALESARADARTQVVDLAAVTADVPSEDGPGTEIAAAIPTQKAPVRDTPEPASGPSPGGPSSLGAPPSRLMVADLVPSRIPVVHDSR